MAKTSGPSAPGRLELVRAFVNTWDIEAGIDMLEDAEKWQEWARRHDLPGELSPRDVGALRSLRESIREGALANHDRAPLPDRTREELDKAGKWAGVVPRFTPHGVCLEPAGKGDRLVVGAVVSAVATALADGSWTRLKACRDDTCQWAFYDHSRSRTGQWCHMEVCGNRNKQARWRQRKTGGNCHL